MFALQQLGPILWCRHTEMASTGNRRCIISVRSCACQIRTHHEYNGGIHKSARIVAKHHAVQMHQFILDWLLEQVCVDPRPSALNMTLPAFAIERVRRKRLSIDTCYRSISSKPAARRCSWRSTGQTDGQTDGHTDRQTDRQTDTWSLHRFRFLGWRPSAVLDFLNWNFQQPCTSETLCIILPNFVEVGHTVAGIAIFAFFSVEM